VVKLYCLPRLTHHIVCHLQKFLYSPFPVESCLKDRLCENLNAEIAIGTVKSVIDALGYMTWTFFARRVKANPSFYGAESGSDECVEQFLLKVVNETVGKLREHGCVEAGEDDDDSDLSPTILGTAACKYYLLCGTPKEMQFGVREARRMVESCLENEESRTQSTASSGTNVMPLERSARVDEVVLAWLLYTLASTHEFDELPVRHNEEILNEELSDDLMWGPDTQSLLSGNRDQYHNPEIFEDPHTK
jgi:activating signal cointegrator complex subunit 3